MRMAEFVDCEGNTFSVNLMYVAAVNAGECCSLFIYPQKEIEIKGTYDEALAELNAALVEDTHVYNWKRQWEKEYVAHLTETDAPEGGTGG